MKMVFVNAPKRKFSSIEKPQNTLFDKGSDQNLKNICKTDGTNSLASLEDNNQGNDKKRV